ncbi:MAG: thiamine-phosphate kinase [Desulfovibrio sp.]|nr:thiamine-phosphate kinase [Desulfovibrio sp.]
MGFDKSLLSEDATLEALARRFPNSHSRLDLCRGDDCAIFKGDRKFCVSADLFLEDVHFRRSYFSAAEIGHKALAVNISDLAACGARPTAFFLSLGFDESVGEGWLDGFFGGMAALAGKYGLVLAGGDLSRSARLVVSITVIGEALDGAGFLKRGGSMPGDAIFAVGELGLARVGLLALEREGEAARTKWPACCEAHLRPTPKVEAGLMLARAGGNARPPALMDVSDGVCRDLPRLLGLSGELASHSGNLGAKLEYAESWLHPEVVAYWREENENPVLQTLIGGEDYALLGSCAPDMAQTLRKAIPGFRLIGKVTGDGELRCDDVNLAGLRGFDHFA